MKSLPHSSRSRSSRVALNDPCHRLIEQAYRVFERPSPRHVPGCRCALCSDPDRARRTVSIAARDWTAEDVLGWVAGAAAPDTGRASVKVVSRTDRAVFRFLLPRVLEMIAAGVLPMDGTTARALAQFAPARLARHATAEQIVMHRFGALVLDRAIHDAEWPQTAIGTLQMLACGGWSVPCLLRQSLNDPDLPAALARSWGRAGRREPLLSGGWPAGSVGAVRAALLTPLMVERMMNYAMADGTSPEETDAAMRAADLILRNL